MAIKIVRWLIFGVVLGLIPFGMSIALIAGDNWPNIDFQAAALGGLKGGGLAILAAGICGAAVGELFFSKQTFRILKLIAGGFCLISLLSCALFFASIAQAASLGNAYDPVFVTLASIGLFVFSTICSGSCIALSEV